MFIWILNVKWFRRLDNCKCKGNRAWRRCKICHFDLCKLPVGLLKALSRHLNSFFFLRGRKRKQEDIKIERLTTTITLKRQNLNFLQAACFHCLYIWVSLSRLHEDGHFSQFCYCFDKEMKSTVGKLFFFFTALLCRQLLNPLPVP